MTNIIQAEEDRRAFGELSAAAGLSTEHARDVIDAMTDCYVMPAIAPKRPLGRVARIFHRRGMWSVSAAMLAEDSARGDEP